MVAPLRAEEPHAISLIDVTQQTGIDFLHRDGSSGARYLIETVAAGLASFDYDRDGLIDLYFLNGSALKGTEYAEVPRNGLYRNEGGWSFTDRTLESGLGDELFGLGVTIGDYDNDGFPDVYLSNWGANRLYHNNGDGTFTMVDNQPVLDCGHKVGGGACMLDIDSDGNLDIFAASYIHFSYDMPSSVFRGRVVYGGPLLFPPGRDDLLKNLGDGTFVNITENAGMGRDVEWGMGTICLDFDQDGDTDILVANDSTRNFLWVNDGQGNFEEMALVAGIAYDHRGDPQGSMGIDAADFHGDGWLDIYQTAFTKQLATLYQNLGHGFFQDRTLPTGAGAGTFYAVNWGGGFIDLDNDGFKDLFLGNGHIHDNLDDFDETVQYKIRNQVLRNLRGKRFEDVTAGCGDGLRVLESSRGVVFDDFDNDGRVDVAILNSRTQPTILRNESRHIGSGTIAPSGQATTRQPEDPTPGNWLALDLVGLKCNRDAVGSRVVIQAGPLSQTLEVHSGRGYQSHYGSRLHFGLGEVSTIDRLEIYWHGGEMESYEDLPVNQWLLVLEGSPPERLER